MYFFRFFLKEICYVENAYRHCCVDGVSAVRWGVRWNVGHEGKQLLRAWCRVLFPWLALLR